MVIFHTREAEDLRATVDGCAVTFSTPAKLLFSRDREYNKENLSDPLFFIGGTARIV